jgi:XTP/dITP diphosphohydrolase
MQKENKTPEVEFKLKGKVIFFATNNIHKFNEARKVLSDQGLAVGMLKVKAVEIQSDTLSEIASASSVDAFKRCHLPVIVEDAGLFLEALNGFPGPYSAYVYKTLGNAGVLKLMENTKNRKAKFQSAIAYCDNMSSPPVCFEAESIGEMTKKERCGNLKPSFGFDPIFKPLESMKTFAEMTIEEKNCFSHRAVAIRKFANWYKNFTFASTNAKTY